MCLTPEFAVYIGVGTLGFVVLGLLLMDSGLPAYWILGIGMVYGWVVEWLEGLAKARIDERRDGPTSEEVSA